MIILPSRNGMLLRNSNGIISSDCGGPVAFTCPCELLTGTNCSCFGTNLTPSTYIADFGEMGKFCLNYVSGCTWQKSVGTITVTLNLTYATNKTRLTVVDGSTTVFSGDLVATSCDGRKYGTITNTVSPSDWTNAMFIPACSTACGGRMVKIEIDLLSSLIHKSAFFNDINKNTINRYFTAYGYMSNNASGCEMSTTHTAAAVKQTYTSSCSLSGSAISNTTQSVLLYNITTGVWRVLLSVGGGGWFMEKTLTKNIDSFAIGERIVMSAVALNGVAGPGYQCFDYDVAQANSPSSYTVPSDVFLTVY